MNSDDYKKREKLRRLRECFMLFFLLLAGGYYLFFGRGQEGAAMYRQTLPLQETAQADAMGLKPFQAEGQNLAGGAGSGAALPGAGGAAGEADLGNVQRAGTAADSMDAPVLGMGNAVTGADVSGMGAWESGGAAAGMDGGGNPLAGANMSETADGWQGEGGAAQNLDPNDGRININTAGMEELETLPGIGPATAQLIIEYRESYGGFADIAEIQNVKRIGEKTFEKIKDLIKV